MIYIDLTMKHYFISKANYIYKMYIYTVKCQLTRKYYDHYLLMDELEAQYKYI